MNFEEKGGQEDRKALMQIEVNCSREQLLEKKALQDREQLLFKAQLKAQEESNKESMSKKKSIEAQDCLAAARRVHGFGNDPFSGDLHEQMDKRSMATQHILNQGKFGVNQQPQIFHRQYQHPQMNLFHSHQQYFQMNA